MQRLFFDDDPECFENEQDIHEYTELFDIKDIILTKKRKFYSTISFKHTNIKTFTPALSLKVYKLLSELGIENLIMVAHVKRSFIGNLDNNYPPLQSAFKKLNEITGDVNYEGALKFGLEDLGTILEIAFWIQRCDATAPEFIFFHDENERLSFYLCQYGNVHFLEFKKKILNEEILAKYGWSRMAERCHDKFSKTGRIQGRATKV